jgi:hypothetical protein
MQRKNLLIFIGLVTGIWIGSTPVQGQIEPTIPAQDAQSQTTQTSPPDRDWSQVVIDAQGFAPRISRDACGRFSRTEARTQCR